MHTREKHQQHAHFFLIIYVNELILYMFRTNNCSSSEGLYEQLTVLHHASCEESGRRQDVTDQSYRVSD